MINTEQLPQISVASSIVNLGLALGAWKWCAYVNPQAKLEEKIADNKYSCIKIFSDCVNSESKIQPFLDNQW